MHSTAEIATRGYEKRLNRDQYLNNIIDELFKQILIIPPFKYVGCMI